MTTVETSDRVRNLIAFALVGSFVGALVDFTVFAVPSSNKDIITYMVGQLSGMATMALGYFFTNKVGQDTLDAKRSETTGKMADAVTAALAAPPVPVEEKLAAAVDAVAGAATDAAETAKGEQT